MPVWRAFYSRRGRRPPRLHAALLLARGFVPDQWEAARQGEAWKPGLEGCGSLAWDRLPPQAMTRTLGSHVHMFALLLTHLALGIFSLSKNSFLTFTLFQNTHVCKLSIELFSGVVSLSKNWIQTLQAYFQRCVNSTLSKLILLSQSSRKCG